MNNFGVTFWTQSARAWRQRRYPPFRNHKCRAWKPVVHHPRRL